MDKEKEMNINDLVTKEVYWSRYMFVEDYLLKK